MAGWIYRLESEGKELRRLIDTQEQTLENVVRIYNQIINCLEYWKKRLRKSDIEDWEYDIETMIEDLQCACPDLEDDTLIYDEEEENLNCYLSDFYDMCDAARVWIGV